MSGTLNGALSTPGYLLALLRELSQYPRALTEIIIPKQVRKTNLDMFLVSFQKKGWKIDPHDSNLRTRGFLFGLILCMGSPSSSTGTFSKKPTFVGKLKQLQLSVGNFFKGFTVNQVHP